MNSGSKGASSGGRQRTQSLLVVAEVALTVVLLASAGLLLRSLAKAASVDPGFEPSRILAFQVSLPDVSYESREKRLAFTGDLLDSPSRAARRGRRGHRHGDSVRRRRLRRVLLSRGPHRQRRR